MLLKTSHPLGTPRSCIVMYASGVIGNGYIASWQCLWIEILLRIDMKAQTLRYVVWIKCATIVEENISDNNYNSLLIWLSSE